jgi:hypothetical protein
MQEARSHVTTTLETRICLFQWYRVYTHVEMSEVQNKLWWRIGVILAGGLIDLTFGGEANYIYFHSLEMRNYYTSHLISTPVDRIGNNGTEVDKQFAYVRRLDGARHAGTGPCLVRYSMKRQNLKFGVQAFGMYDSIVRVEHYRFQTCQISN